MSNEIESIKERAKERLKILDEIIKKLKESKNGNLRLLLEIAKENIKYVVYNEMSITEEERNKSIEDFIKGVKNE